jgi:glycosyltransferase involved in cell wall biosynthesis
MADLSDPLPPIGSRYLLVIHIPVLQAPDGSRWLDRLWAIDLLRHTDYLSDLTVVCPLVHGEPTKDDVNIDGAPIKFVFMPFGEGVRTAVRYLPRVIATLWRAIGRTQVVHSTLLGGWLPISAENICNRIAHWRHRFLFIIVESSTWRLAPGKKAGWIRRFKAWRGEQVNRRSIRWSDLAVFTHQQYLEDLAVDCRERAHVIPASWINEDDILSRDAAVRSWREKNEHRPATLKLLFAARLIETKGVEELLRAIDRSAPPASASIELDIIGDGPLRARCEAAALASTPRKKVRVLDPVPYGPGLFALIRGYDALVVPNLLDEQPRITFDAGAQGVPVLGFATDGLRSCVLQNMTGKLVETGDIDALASLLEWAAEHRDRLQQMGLQARELASTNTHQSMHRQRHRLLTEVLGQRGLLT